MARRRTKKRTHVGARNGPSGSSAAMDRSPKSMVVRMGAGEVGPSVSQLVRDVRAMMEPGTAARLKERKANRLKDFITMAGPLGVSHLLLFSRSTSGNTNLRIALTPRGPTLHFKVEKYSLCKDVTKAIKHPKAGKKEFIMPPLLVMNNFISSQQAQETSSSDPNTNNVPRHLETLTTSIFQSLFPPISPQSTPLSSIRRVLLLNREPPSPKSIDPNSPEPGNGAYTINLRHYAITTRPTGLSSGIRRLKAAEKLITSRERKRKGIPNLGRLEDVADYLLDPSAAASGYTSASETEIETDAEIEVLAPKAKKVLSSVQRKKLSQRVPNSDSARIGRTPERRAVKLVELGPRMRLRMIKVEEGVCGGKVMWHEFLHKTKEEERTLEQLWERRSREKEERRQKQKEDVERKKRERGGGAGKMDGDGDEEMGDDDDDDEYERHEWDSEGLEGDAEMLVNEEKEEAGEWTDEEEEIAAG